MKAARMTCKKIDKKGKTRTQKEENEEEEENVELGINAMLIAIHISNEYV